MRTKVKFRCESVKDFGSSVEVELCAVTGDTKENAEFSKYTLAGSLKMTVLDNQIGLFEPNKEYYIDFTEAE